MVDGEEEIVVGEDGYFLCLKEKREVTSASSEEPMPRALHDVLFGLVAEELAKKAVASAALIA
jgi:hypothetical protein